MSRTWHQYFVYISLVFVAVALYRFDYLNVPSVSSYPALVASLTLQLGGFLCLVASWNVVLGRAGCPVRFNEGLAALGLSILGNYVPGKVWLVLGRAGYVAQRRGYALGKLSVLSLHAQLIALWAGLMLGAAGALHVGGMALWGPLILLLWLALTLTVFTRTVHKLVARVAGTLLRRKLSIPLVSLGASGTASAWAVAAWAIWASAFYAFLLAVGLPDATPADGLAFPLAATLGVVALIAPGGLGAREAVLVGYLVLAGHGLAESTTVAVAARIWFLAGELLLFVVGWATDLGARVAAVRG